MKSFVPLLALASIAVASPFVIQGQEQYPLGTAESLPVEETDFSTYPGFSLDLDELRLVQVEGQSPEWISELQKVFT